jgi:predicted transcriptional regulator of viral defense system
MQKLAVKEKLLAQAREKVLVRPKDFDKIKGARVHLSQLVESGELVKVGRGLYALADGDFDERRSLLEAARLVPKGVICLLSALRFHELTTQNPFEVWLAIEGTSRKPRIETLPLNILRFSGAAYQQGIETHEAKGIALRVYNPAKTVADCFKYRNKIGLDVALEALRNAWRQKKATADELWHYVKICRMSNVMRPYLESLV